MDWLQTVRDVAASGVDVLGMAGGDGSQALVGTVAAELGLPMVVVPAGTRNHLALDLGLDRDDVVGALDAYGEAVERHLDLADLNGHVFVNNVSLGLYAAIVRPRRTATQRSTPPSPRSRRCWGPTPSPSTCASPGPTAWSTAGRTSSRSRTTPTAPPRAASRAAPAWTPTSSASSR